MNPEQINDFDVLRAQIDKKFGKGTIQSLSADEIEPVEVIHTGSIAVDTALGVGGYPVGRIVEIFGQESTGKSTLCLQAIVNAQKAGKRCIYIDTEHSLDVNYARNLGVDIENLAICQPDYGEQALEIVNMCAKSGTVGLIIVDSVAALTPKAELEGEVGDASVGRQALMMSKAMRMITGSLNRSDCTVIFTNQIRQKIGVMFGSPNTVSGGNALKFYASVRIELSKLQQEKEGEKIVGNKVKAKIVKNKMAPPFREGEFVIGFGKGVDQAQEILDMAIEDSLLEKSGSWFKYKGQNIGQGRLAALDWLQENEKIREEVKNEILSLRGLN